MRRNQHGDTIIEVMLALALLSAILFTSWAIVNRSTQINLAARKRVEMVNELKEQAEVIKSLHPEIMQQGGLQKPDGQPVAPVLNVAADVSFNPCQTTRDASGTLVPRQAFHINRQGEVADGVRASTGNAQAQVSWVQMASVGQADGYFDFYIRACWLAGSGSQQREDSSQIIVRLNKS